MNWKLTAITMTLTFVVSMIGCKPNTDRRLIEMAQRHEQRQAEQTQQANELHREVTAMHREVQSERAEVSRQRDQLEEERRSIAKQRRTDSLAAAAVQTAGLWIACLLPLLIAWLVLRQPEQTDDDRLVVDLMLDDFASSAPQLLERPTNRHPTMPRLPEAAESDSSET